MVKYGCPIQTMVTCAFTVAENKCQITTDLTVLDFDGHVVAHKKNVTMQRNASVEFSPAVDRILVGSWDNTLSVFSIAENGK